MSAAPEFAVIGDGAWGTALSRRLARGGAGVHLVGLHASRRKLTAGIAHTTDLAAALRACERVLIAVPIADLDALLRSAASHFEGHHRVVTTARGLTPCEGKPRRASELVELRTCVRQIAVLAGSADAAAVEREHPVALVVGSAFPSWAGEVQAALTSDTMRVYTNDDPVGVELANALANVMAVAMGVARALNVGAATEATALTRALAEMDRLVRDLGGEAGTAYGLAGLGVLADLVFEAGGEAYEVGRLLIAGRRDEVAAHHELRQAAGTLAARATAQGVRAPMVGAVHAMLEGEASPMEALTALMSRAARAE